MKPCQHIFIEKMNKETAKDASKPRIKWYAWLLLLLLPLAMYTPFLASRLQIDIVGQEHVCCMPDNLQELLKKAQVARSRRSESDAIMNGVIWSGIILLIVFVVLFYTIIWSKLNHPAQIFSGTIIGIIVLAILMWLLHLLEWYGANTEEYYQYAWSMQWPFV